MQPWFIDFAEAIDDGTATYRRCVDCDDAMLPPRQYCPDCLDSEFEEVPMPTDGTVETHTTITSTIPAFEDVTPYTIVFARFENGLALSGQWRGSDDVSIGEAVTLAAEAVDDGWILTFHPQ